MRIICSHIGSSHYWLVGKKVKYPCSRTWRPIELWDVEAPTFYRQSAHRWRRCQPYAPAHPWYSGWVDPVAIVRLEGLGELENPITLTGTEPATFRLRKAETLFICSSYNVSYKVTNWIKILQGTGTQGYYDNIHLLHLTNNENRQKNFCFGKLFSLTLQFL
jgi:hypothetical protein